MKSLTHNSKRPSQNSEGIDLDVTPIMNMFVILIPFLVSMAVFTHYSVLEFSLPPNAGIGSGGPGKEDLKLTVVVQSLGYDLTVGDSLLETVGSASESDAFTNLESSLSMLRPQLARQNEVVVAVDDGIEFDIVVKVMDACKKSGFEKVALAEGPNRPTNIPVTRTSKSGLAHSALSQDGKEKNVALLVGAKS